MDHAKSRPSGIVFGFVAYAFSAMNGSRQGSLPRRSLIRDFFLPK